MSQKKPFQKLKKKKKKEIYKKKLKRKRKFRNISVQLFWQVSTPEW